MAGCKRDFFESESDKFSFGLLVQNSMAASMFNSPEPKKLFGTEENVSLPHGVTPKGTKMGRAVCCSNF